MIVFHTDLDSTMIFSYKHDIGPDKRNVEIYYDREISFITEKTYELMKKVKERVLFVPTTTRSVEQYNRIDLGIGPVKYALTCNGGILLVNGIEDENWYQESKELIEPSVEEMHKAMDWLAQDARTTFEVRFIRDLFVFTKCDHPEEVVAQLRKMLNTELVDAFHTGIKVFVVPKELNKGKAIARFRNRVASEYIIAAGDTEFDISMFEEAEIAIAPKRLADAHALPEKTKVMPEKKIYSEEVLEYVLEQIS